jgi:hypothetical protein
MAPQRRKVENAWMASSFFLVCSIQAISLLDDVAIQEMEP